LNIYTSSYVLLLGYIDISGQTVLPTGIQTSYSDGTNDVTLPTDLLADMTHLDEVFQVTIKIDS